jgi:hypothetical protein
MVGATAWVRVAEALDEADRALAAEADTLAREEEITP